VIALPLLVLLAVVSAAVGSLGGLGGAVFLVPGLVLVGIDPREAAPLGILTVAAGSLAAAARQLREGVVHHRLGVTLEIPASIAAIVGAVVGGLIARAVLTRLLALVALAAAVVGARRKGLRNQPHPTFIEELPGEWPGTLAGAYRLGDGVVPYRARRLPAGLAAMVGAGLAAGIAGVGGGFIKTPTMSEVMHVPVRVAAATTTFTVGITATASLVVFAGQGRIDYRAAAAVVVGGLAGGTLGARLQAVLPPQGTRLVLSLALLVVALVLGIKG
jgi:uncharacterized membrane protein YfcA